MRQPAGRRHHLVQACAIGSGEQVQDRVALGRSWVGSWLAALTFWVLIMGGLLMWGRPFTCSHHPAPRQPADPGHAATDSVGR